MFFLTMIFRSFGRQLRRRLLIAITVCLSAAVSVCMLGVVFDVGDKVNAELSTYGSNIVVQPKAQAVVANLYNSESQDNVQRVIPHNADAYLQESDLPKMKTIFWAFNIVNFVPKLNMWATVQGPCNAKACTQHNVRLTGTWFRKQLNLPTGERSVVGLQGMRAWWQLQGSWAHDVQAVYGLSAQQMHMHSSGMSSDHGAADNKSANRSTSADRGVIHQPGKHTVVQGMIGDTLAKKIHVQIGQHVTLVSSTGHKQHLLVTGIYHSSDNDDYGMYIPISIVQQLANLPNAVGSVEVKALTAPENDLARRAARDPAALSQEDWETWYCTAYPSSIAYQIEEVIPGAIAKQVRQIAALQGAVLQKTEAVMILMTVLSLIAAAIAVANLLSAAISQRSAELALLKSVGASDGAVCRFMLAEIALNCIVGAIIGAGLGSLMAQVVGKIVFNAWIDMRPMVFVLVFVLLAITILLASLSSIRSIIRLRPATVLHGR